MPYYSFYKDETMMFRHPFDESPNNDPFYMHIHDQFEILYFISGEASCTVETTTTRLLPDTMIIMRPMESHRITILGKSPYERYTLNFSTELADIFDNERKLLAPFFDRPLGQNNVYHSSEFDISPKKLFAAMEKPVSALNEKNNILTYFYALLGQINSVFEERKQDFTSFEKTLASQAAKYINTHLYDELSVQIIADHFYVSVSQLNRQFKKASGFSIWEYIIGKRLVSVRNLIRDGVPVTHAYQQCGFNDYSSFYRLYIKKFGVPPKSDIVKSGK